MTEAETWKFWKRYADYLSLGTQRKGQALMNALWDTNQDLYERVCQTDGADPFFFDARIPAFFKVIGLTDPGTSDD
jgi:hypothetical protein